MTVVLEDEGVRAEIDPANGARLTSLSFGGHEVLATGHTESGERIGDGCFPMAPWAGRVGGGRIEQNGIIATLPVDSDGNAIHGLVRNVPWEQVTPTAFACRVGAPWPQSGEARLNYRLAPHSLTIEFGWNDATDFPCSLGLHPWFLDTLATGERLVLDIEATAMVERGERHLPTGRFVPVGPHPWDDCFRMGRSPILNWPGALSLRLDSSSPWWVVFDEPAFSTCVEPQTAPPDAFAHEAFHPEVGDWPRFLRFTMTALG